MRLRTIKNLNRVGVLLCICWFALSAMAIWVSVNMGLNGEIKKGFEPTYYIVGNLIFFSGGFIFLGLWKLWIKRLLRINGLDGLLER